VTRSNPPARNTVLAIWAGFVVSRALQVAAELGIADRLAAGAKDAASLAEEIGAHEGHLRRLLRTLASAGVFAEEDGHFRLTPLAEVLRSDAPGSIRDVVRMYDDALWNAFGSLEYSVRTGRPAFEKTAGSPYYAYLADHPEVSRRWNRGVANLSAHDDAVLARAYDFSDVETVVDVGGGQGGFLAGVLAANPHLRGVLFDLPHVVTNATVLRASVDATRCEIRSGDFFESVPPRCDVYVLKRLLPGFDDDRCIAVLRRCRAAMPPHGRLLGIEALVPTGNEPHPSKVSDLLMMVQGEGRERTEPEYRELYRAAGLEIRRVLPTGTALSILEGIPVREGIA
jgi:hypothetical protein